MTHKLWVIQRFIIPMLRRIRVVGEIEKLESTIKVGKFKINLKIINEVRKLKLKLKRSYTSQFQWQISKLISIIQLESMNFQTAAELQKKFSNFIRFSSNFNRNFPTSDFPTKSLPTSRSFQLNFPTTLILP